MSVFDIEILKKGYGAEIAHLAVLRQGAPGTSMICVQCSRGFKKFIIHALVGRWGCDQNWRQFRLAVSTANRSWRFNNCQFCWQLALTIKIGVLATANFVGSWHWQLSIGSWQLCIGSWQLSIGS